MRRVRRTDGGGAGRGGGLGAGASCWCFVPFVGSAVAKRHSATMRDTVAELTFQSRAVPAIVRLPLDTSSIAAARCSLSSFRGRPPTRPSRLACARPARVRSRIIARSNSANDPTICIIIRPAAVVVSTASVRERKPAPVSEIRSMTCRTSFSDRDNRSSFHTTIVSPSRS